MRKADFSMTAHRAELLALVLSVSVLVTIPGISAASEFDFRFSTPSQIHGSIDLEGASWLLVVFRNPSESVFDLTFTRATETNSTYLEEKQTETSGSRVPVPLPPSTRNLGPIDARLDFNGQDWASLLVVADTISLASPSSWTNLKRGETGDFVEDFLPGMADPSTRFQPYPTNPQPSTVFWLDEPGPVFSIQGPTSNEPTPFSVAAQGIRHLEWHNATTTCPGYECPESGGAWGVSADLKGPLWLQRLSFIHLETTDGRLEGSGQALGLATGGAVLDANVSGQARFPGAITRCGDDRCPIPAGQTLSLAGAFGLQDLQPSADTPNGLQSRFSGDLAGVQFDEERIPDFNQIAVAVGTGLAVAGLAYAAKLVALFARSARPPALENPKRKELHRLIIAEPGLSFRAVQRRLGWPIGTLKFHMDRLLEEGHVKAEPYRNTVRYFENHGKYAKTWRELTPMRDPEVKRLHSWLREHPGLDQTRIAEATRQWGWDRSKLRRRLNSLLEAGLVDGRKVGRRTEYDAKPYGA